MIPDPSLGIFISIDPLKYGTKHTLYLYSDNNPVLLIDPSGFGPGVEIDFNPTIDYAPDKKPYSIEKRSCGDATFKIKWKLTTKETGWVIQTVHLKCRPIGCDSSNPIKGGQGDCNIGYSEAWQVDKGHFVDQGSDTFILNVSNFFKDTKNDFFQNCFIFGSALFVNIKNTPKPHTYANLKGFQKPDPADPSKVIDPGNACGTIGLSLVTSGALRFHEGSSGPQWLNLYKKSHKNDFVTHALAVSWNCCDCEHKKEEDIKTKTQTMINNNIVE